MSPTLRRPSAGSIGARDDPASSFWTNEDRFSNPERGAYSTIASFDRRSDAPRDRAAAARGRAAAAAEAARRARARIKEAGELATDPSFVEEAEERRVSAEERLARTQEDLRRARDRSASAHDAAAKLDDSVGKHAAAAIHRRDAKHDRELAQGDGDDA